jgi:hypothetical protein
MVIELPGNLFDFWRLPSSVICIPVNHAVDKYGDAIMGAGVALEMKRLAPGIERELGLKLRSFPDDEAYCLDEGHVRAIPTKFHPRDKEASLELIERATWWLKAETKAWPHVTFISPRLGCGLGKLDWEVVKIFLEELGENFWVVTP